MIAGRRPVYPPRDRFVRQWLLWTAVAAVGLLAWRGADAPSASQPSRAEAGHADWYLVLRMPAVTSQRESGVETMRQRYAAWLDAMLEDGFRPMRLSEVWGRLSRRQRLPERTVVAVFEPGLRKTLAVIGPIFESRDFPAVWLSDDAAMSAAHREYVTYHKAAQMTRSGWWDVGYSLPGGGYRLESREGPPLPLGGSGRPWSGIDGTFALDRGPRLSHLDILTVNSDWTPEELVDRLRAEIPAAAGGWLSKAVIHHKEWGVLAAEGDGSGSPRPFDLEAPDNRRGSRLFWLGTRGLDDFRAHLRAASLIGELQLSARCDEKAGRELVVSIDAESISVVLRQGAASTRLYSHRRRRRSTGAALDVALIGRRLSVAEPGQTPWTSSVLDAPGGPSALLALTVFEKARGLARARGVTLKFEPALPTEPLWADMR